MLAEWIVGRWGPRDRQRLRGDRKQQSDQHKGPATYMHSSHHVSLVPTLVDEDTEAQAQSAAHPLKEL